MIHGEEIGVSYLPLSSIAAQVHVCTYMYMSLPQWSHNLYAAVFLNLNLRFPELFVARNREGEV